MLTRRGFLEVMGAAGGLAAVGCAGRPRTVVTGWPRERVVDRMAVVRRHNVRVRSVDPLAVLSVGNGEFAFNVDCTGLQSFYGVYTKIPLATLSHWGWHSMPVPAGLDPGALRYKLYDFHGRKVPYATDSAGQAGVFNYLRENPHRLNLGKIGLFLDGRNPWAAQLSDIDQTLELETGVVTSRFLLAGEKVEVITCCHPDTDGVAIRITSPLLKNQRLAVHVSFPYGSTASSGDGGDWTQPQAHSTVIVRNPQTPRQVTLDRTVDAFRYGVRVGWSIASEKLGFHESASNSYVIESYEQTGDQLAIVVNFDREPSNTSPLFTFEEARAASEKAWRKYWESGAAIDFSECTDARAVELERRVVLSQYLTAIHCAGSLPSQETGLLCNSWYGKFHLEMHWWHSVHFAAWGREALFERSVGIYAKWLATARELAASQGFAGARWPKMVGPDGKDSPSTIGPLLIWQQPHPIYYAEMCYRASPTAATLRKWRDVVVATAEFMASYAVLDSARGEYVLGPALRTVSENNDDTTINPAYELTAWRFGLMRAQKWLQRMGEPRNRAWDEVLAKLARPSVKDGVYVMQEGQATFTKEWAWEHPALLGALGVLPGDGIDAAVMAATVRKVRETWDFDRVWGWDFPVCAMAAARTGQADLAMDFLLMESQMNGYLKNGCNFQRDNVPAYFPGNGGLLATIAMMAGGWEGGPGGETPGFPKNGKWKVKAEGFGKWM